jgi:putative transcriptional regulator
MDKPILELVHEDAKELYKSGLMDEITLRAFDALCLPPIKKYTAKQIKKL